MNWQHLYNSRLASANEAILAVKPGDHVVLQHACGEPRALVEALVATTELENIVVSHMAALGPAEYAQPGMEGKFRHNAFFAGAATRKAIDEGRADFTCCFFHELPRVYREYLRPDVAMIQVSPPDLRGYCSLGISVDYTKHVAEYAKTVIAQVNRNMPRTFGESYLHVSEIDYFVEQDRPLLEIPIPEITETEQEIGRNVAGLIEDGSCLQLGIGAIPDAVLMFLENKRDLGIHTEMFSDGVIRLVEGGVITGRAKNIDRGKMVAAFVMGSKRIYEFINENPMVELRTVDYTNDPFIIGQINRVVSINSALQVDLLGQVCADTIGFRQYSAVGGQVDFIRGAARSQGGKAIIAMPSTAGRGYYSRIVPLLETGSAVTTSRYDVQHVVTEYGVANLRYKTNRERAMQLISVAHPAFRDQLIAAAQKRNLL